MMIMDPSFRAYSGSIDGIHLENPRLFPNPSFVSVPRFGDIDDGEAFLETGDMGYRCPPPKVALASDVYSLSCDSPEDCDFSDTVLNYISQILMEEDVVEESRVFQEESVDLEAAEKPFYEALGKKYPPSPEPNRGYVFRDRDGAEENFLTDFKDYTANGDIYGLVDNALVPNLTAYNSPLCDLSAYGVSQSSYSSPSSVISSGGGDGLLDSPGSIVKVPDFGGKSQSVWQFQRGVEEASRFLPNNENVKAEKRDEQEISSVLPKGRKNHCRGGDDAEEEEGRSNKQAAIYIESTLRSKMSDLILLCSNGDGASHLTSVRETMRNGVSQSTTRKNGPARGRFGGKVRGRKAAPKKEVVDLRTLLIQCAQAVAADDHRSASELLKQVRHHGSPFGDGSQRLANCFADGLEARLAGTGSQIYKGLVSKRTCGADVLNAYLIYIAACPFRKISNFASNRTIRSVAAKETTIHVIDFGILYGFQWPTFIQRLALERPGCIPKVRITGIEFPQSGFRPAERVEEAGRRLKAYADGFNVPFEYIAIAKKWETITLDDLKIQKGEFVVVNCLYRAKNLLDESVSVDSPRNGFLNLVKRIKPNLFIHGIVNGSYNAPFFVTRFREALFHFSAIFDMLETIVPRSELQRMLLEKEIFGKEALNVIACEGSERVERPETYKQWQIRIMRSGFFQVPFARDIMKGATVKVRSNYHRDFVIDEDTGWLLQGWKGRIMFALSLWKPS